MTIRLARWTTGDDVRRAARTAAARPAPQELPHISKGCRAGLVRLPALLPVKGGAPR